MSILDNKYIPMQDSIMYTIDLIPKKVDPNGRIRTPEEIKNGTKEFVHTVYIDQIGNVYIIPMKYEDNVWIDYYTPIDIVKTAMGDKAAKQLIESCRTQIKEEFKRDLISDIFMQRLYDNEKDQILDSINRRRLENDEEPLNITLPNSPKTISNFTLSELKIVIDSALPIQNND